MKRPRGGSPLALLPSRSIVAGTFLVATVAAIGLFFARPAAVEIDGRRIATDVPPVTRTHDVFVPVRAVAEGLGASTSFNPRTREVSIERGQRVLRMRLGEKDATLNGDPIVLAQAPFALRGRAMVVSVAIERAFGPRIRYDRARAKIDVVSRELLEADATKDK